MNNGWQSVTISEVAEINPKRPRDISRLPDDYPVSFVPMPAVNQLYGIIEAGEIKPLRDVRKGFTYFAEGDVIFAKITPCMQNGKSAIAQHLSKGLGFGSTEFHVIRPNPEKVLAEWIWYYVRQDSFRREAIHHFRGAVGQQRVPPEYLAETTIPLPKLEDQVRIVNRINECLERMNEIEENNLSIDQEIKELFPAILNYKFEELKKTATVEKLEDVAEIKGGGSLPKHSDANDGDDSILLIKVGDMNQRGNEKVIQLSRTYLPLSKANKKLIQPGAVIFPKRGGAIATNKKRILGRPAMIDPNLMAVVAKADRIDSDYLYYWIQTLDLTTISNGGVIPQLNRKDLAPLDIPVPEIGEQKIIVNEMLQAESFCFEQRVLFDESKIEKQTLRESILYRAFKGEL